MAKQSMLFRGDCWTPPGWVEMEASDLGLRALRALDNAPSRCVQGPHPLLTECARQLYEYFEEGAAPSISPSTRRARRGSTVSGPRCAQFPTVRPKPMAASRPNLAHPPHRARSA